MSRYIDFEAGRTHFLEWPGPANAETLLLVHGFMGHAHWWDFVAPVLAESYRVLSMDLGGMGDSSYRPPYSLERYVAEIVNVIRHSKAAPLTLIGHSFGGRCTILTAHSHPELIRRAMAVDSHVSFPDPTRKPVFDGNPMREKKRYDDLEVAKRRFRLVPEEPGTPPRIFDHIAGHALKRDGDAWVWKFDPAIVARGEKPLVSDARALPLLKVPMDYVYGQWSKVVTYEHAQKIAAAIPEGRAPIVIPGAYHHVPVGQPQALASTLLALLARNQKA
jgi:pimeloyl-ACP methyl ester carboxylesterase